MYVLHSFHSCLFAFAAFLFERNYSCGARHKMLQVDSMRPQIEETHKVVSCVGLAPLSVLWPLEIKADLGPIYLNTPHCEPPNTHSAFRSKVISIQYSPIFVSIVKCYAATTFITKTRNQILSNTCLIRDICQHIDHVNRPQDRLGVSCVG